MINFIFGTSRNKKNEYILSKMREEIASGKGVLCISPETEALSWDRRAAENLTPPECFKVETLSFSRLADSLFRVYGGSAKNYITDAKKSVLMWRAIKSVSSLLKSFGEGREEKYIQIMLSAVREAKMYGGCAEAYSKAAEALEEENEVISKRLYDFSLIWAAYEELLHTSYDDPEEILDRLYEITLQNNCFENKAVFIDSFYSFTPKERNIIREIFTGAEAVYVSFENSAADRDSIHTEHLREEKKNLAKIANELGLEVNVYECKKEIVSPALCYLRDNLWNYSAPEYAEKTDAVKLYTAGDRFDEANVCASLIAKLVRKGARYSDISVVCADYESYRGILDSAFETYDIPSYISAKTELRSENIMRFIISAINIPAYGYRREDVLTFAKTRLTSLSPNECDALEKYAEKWRLRGKRAFVCEGWNMNPSGYTDRLSDWDKELLVLANSAREKAITPIYDFSLSLGKTVEEACRGLYKLLCHFSVFEKLEKEAKQLSEKGEGARAHEKRQLKSAIFEILDTLVSASGNEVISPKQFSALFLRAAENIQIATIPDYIDSVHVVSATTSRFQIVRHTIILGAIEGEFPLTPGDNGFFTEQDKEILARYQLVLSPNMSFRRSEELFRFYLAAASCTETLSVIAPTDIGEFSSGVRRIIKLLPYAELQGGKHNDRFFLMQNRSSLKYHLSKRDEPELRAASEKLTEESVITTPLEMAENDSISSEYAKEIFGEEMRLSQSRYEMFIDCPQKYYLSYILSLDDKEEAKISPADIGNFVHKILEEFLLEVRDENIEFPLSDSYTEETAKRLIDKYISRVCPENFGGRLGYIFERVSKTILLYIRSLSDEFSVSKFRPTEFELYIGKGGSLPPLEIRLSDGSSVTMVGVVDRLDCYNDKKNVYVKVVDYKTGNKTFSLNGALEGKNIQLLLYLFSICAAKECEFRRKLCPNGEKILPAGAVYFSAKAGDMSHEAPLDEEEAKEYISKGISRTGLVLNDKAVLLAQEPGGEGKYIPASYNKNGDLSKKSHVATLEEFDHIRDTIIGKIAETGEKMRGGCAAATPSTGNGGVCEYCKMSSICRAKRG